MLERYRYSSKHVFSADAVSLKSILTDAWRNQRFVNVFHVKTKDNTIDCCLGCMTARWDGTFSADGKDLLCFLPCLAPTICSSSQFRYLKHVHTTDAVQLLLSPTSSVWEDDTSLLHLQSLPPSCPTFFSWLLKQTPLATGSGRLLYASQKVQTPYLKLKQIS